MHLSNHYIGTLLGMANEKLFHVGVKGLIKNKNNQYLLLEADTTNHSKNTKAYWDIPGGRIERGADVFTTLQREIKEETGITELQNITFLTSVVSHHEIPISDTQKVGLILMIYTVEIAEDTVIMLSPEHTTYEWVGAVKTAKRLADKYPREFTDKLV